MKLRLATQHCMMAKRTRNELTPSSRSMMERFAWIAVSAEPLVGLSSLLPSVLASVTRVGHEKRVARFSGVSKNDSICASSTVSFHVLWRSSSVERGRISAYANGSSCMASRPPFLPISKS